MEFAVDEGYSHPEFRKIPIIDLRFMSQDEINCAAQWSDEDTELQLKDIVIPKIDRSIFNESAGSRKQTYSRLRFSQRKEELGGLTRRRAGLLSVSRHSVEVEISPTIRRKPANGSDLKDNSQILQLLRGLFMNGDCSLACKNAVEDEIRKEKAPGLQLPNPPLNSESGSNRFSNASHNIQSCNEKQVSGPEPGKYVQLVVRDPEMETEVPSAVLQGTHNEQFNDKLKWEISDAGISDTQMESKNAGISDTQIESKTDLDVDRSRVLAHDNVDRPKKRMRTKEDARRKAFANAEEQIAMKASMFVKDNNTVNDCNATETKAALSTDDKTFSETNHSDITVTRTMQDNIVNNSPTDQKVADVNHGLPQKDADLGGKGFSLAAQEPFVAQLKRKFAPLETEAELQDFFDKVGGQWASKRKRRKIVDAEDFADGFPKGWKLLLGVRKKDCRFLIECRKYISPEGQQFASCREVSAHMLSTHMHCPAVGIAQQPSSNSTSPGDGGGARELNFSNRSNSVAHLTDHHTQKVKKTNTSKSIVDGVIVRNGKYECQICHKVFNERNRYTGHVGVHVRNAKRLNDPLGEISSAGKADIHPPETFGNKFIDDSNVDSTMATSVIKTCDQQGQNGNMDLGKDNANVDSTMATSVTKPCDQQEQNGNMDLGEDNANVDSTMATSVTKPCDQQEQNGNTALGKDNANVVSTMATSVTKPCDQQEQNGNRALGKDNANVDSTLATSVTKPCDQQEQNGNMALGKDNANLDSTMATSVTKPCDQQEQNGNMALGKDNANVDSTIAISVTKPCDQQEQNGNMALGNDNANVDSAMIASVTKPCDQQEQNGYMALGKDNVNVDSTMATSITKPCDQEEQEGNMASETMLDSSSPSGENDFTSSHDEGILSTLDISTKDEIDFNSETQKLDSLKGFEEFQMEYTHSPKFAFQTGQDTDSVIDAQIDLGLDAGVLQQEIDPPGQFEWESVLSKIENSPQVFVCVWCSNQFSHDGLDAELQGDSVGFICSRCKNI